MRSTVVNIFLSNLDDDRLHPQLLWRWQYTRELADMTNSSLDIETLKKMRVGPTKISWGLVSSSRKFCCEAEPPDTLVNGGKMNTDLSRNDLAATADARMNINQLTLQVKPVTDWATFGGVWKTDQEELLLSLLWRRETHLEPWLEHWTLLWICRDAWKGTEDGYKNYRCWGSWVCLVRWTVLRENLTAIYNYWKGTYKDDGAKLMLLSLCPSKFSRQPKKTWLWPNTDI